MRPVALLLAVLSAAIVVASARRRDRHEPSIRVTFSGTAAGRFNDVERWVLLSSNECYLRRLRDQKTALSWNLSFSGGRTLAAAGAATREGRRERDRGTRLVRRRRRGASTRRAGHWLHSLSCNDALLVERPGRATWSQGVLRVRGPPSSLEEGGLHGPRAQRGAQRKGRPSRGPRAEAPARGTDPRWSAPRSPRRAAIGRERIASTSPSRTTATARSTNAWTRSGGAGRSPSRASEIPRRRNVWPPGHTIELRCTHLSPHSAEHSTMPTALRPGWNDLGSPVPVGRGSRDPIGYGGLPGV